jgi:hypothetical protein
MEDLYRLAERDRPEIHITVTHKDKPMVIKPKFKMKQPPPFHGTA